MKDAVSSLFPFSVAMRDTNLHSDYIYIDKTARTVGAASSSPEFQPDDVWLWGAARLRCGNKWIQTSVRVRGSCRICPTVSVRSPHQSGLCTQHSLIRQNNSVTNAT